MLLNHEYILDAMCTFSAKKEIHLINIHASACDKIVFLYLLCHTVIVFKAVLLYALVIEHIFDYVAS